jgi:hypothetical protein
MTQNIQAQEERPACSERKHTKHSSSIGATCLLKGMTQNIQAPEERPVKTVIPLKIIISTIH